MNAYFDKPMSSRPKEEKDRFDRDDYREAVDRNGTKTIHYKDGSSTVHWGGPCGSTNYDQNGEEC